MLLVNIKFKKGFSLVELIFVIVILGIISSVSLSLIFNVYQTYIAQRALSSLTQQTDILSSIIGNYLSKRIKGTLITKKYSDPTDFITLDKTTTDKGYNILEWIGYDYDGFSSFKNIAWSGIANYKTVSQDLNHSVSFETPASNLNHLSSVLRNLSNNKVSLELNKPAGIIFQQKDNLYNKTEEYSPDCMGLTNRTSKACIFSIYYKNGHNKKLFFTNTSKITRNITEMYQLSWTAYSIYIENINDKVSNLYLYYNYQPWNGNMLTDVESTRKLLATNVSVLKYTKSSNNIQLKICLQENLGDRIISACKLRSIL